MNLEQFLEEERKYFEKFKNKCSCRNVNEKCSECPSEQNYTDWLKDHDTRLINKVLDEVQREVENKKLERKERYKEFNLREDEGEISACRDISTIIESLKVK